MKLLKYLGFSRSDNRSSSSKKRYRNVIEDLCHRFSLEDLRKSTNNFDQALKLRGGPVYKGYMEHNGTSDYTIALKRITRSFDQGFLEFTKEIELLCQLHHPNLVSLIRFCNDNDEKILVYEYMPNGSLHDHLYNNRKMKPLSWNQRLEICIGAACGLHYLHSGAKRSIFHLDIKPSNILLDNNMVPKLSYFGAFLLGPLSTSKPKPIEAKNIAGTYGYLAPEYIMYGDVTDKCDVYSFGMVLLEMVCSREIQMIIDKANMLANQSGCLNLEGHCPLNVALLNFSRRFPVEEIIDPILKGKIAPECWQVYMDITQRCFKYEADERPTMGEVEVLLEDALLRQEEADITKTDGDYTLLSATYVDDKETCSSDQEIDSSCGDYNP